jgi:hypothetical protein
VVVADGVRVGVADGDDNGLIGIDIIALHGAFETIIICVAELSAVTTTPLCSWIGVIPLAKGDNVG